MPCKVSPQFKLTKLSESNCCHDFDYRSFYEIVYHAKTKYASLADSVLSRLEYGYGCECDEKNTLERLEGYVVSLERIKKQFLKGDIDCQKCKNTQRLIEKIRDIAADYCLDGFEDITEDKTLQQQWLLKNPYCVVRERYERLAYLLCGQLKVDFKVVTPKDVCNLAYDIAAKTFDCDLLATVAAQKTVCDLGYELKMTKEDCKISFDAIQKKTNCNLNLDTYSRLVNCNISPSFIVKACENGLTLDVDELDQLSISSPSQVYSLNNFDFNNFSVSNCKDCDVTTPTADETFISNLTEEYNISSEHQEKIKKIYG